MLQFHVRSFNELESLVFRTKPTFGYSVIIKPTFNHKYKKEEEEEETINNPEFYKSIFFYLDFIACFILHLM